MAQPRTCPDCGFEIRSNTPEGTCPVCALRAALAPAGADQPPLAAASEQMPPPGTKILYFGDYELVREIGRGGMGVVYQARQISLDRPVALKRILSGRLASETEIKRFLHEAQAAANLQHPNIVAVHEVNIHDGQFYYSMDFVEGTNFEELVRQHPLPAKQAAEYVKAIAEAVQFAHQRGTLHRDLKPTNILLDIFNQPRITDFGLARREHFDPHLTESGQIVGTPAYTSPEQAEAKTHLVGAHSDVYSIGAVLYYLLTQRPPFTADSLATLLGLVIRGEPISPRKLNPSVPRDLETICLKCLQKEPTCRYGSAEQLAAELERFMNGEPILARPTSAPERAWRCCARNPALSASLIAVVFLLVAGGSAATFLAFRATRAEAAARSDAAKNEQILRFLQDMLKGVGPSVARGRDTTMLREILDQTAERVGKELKSQPAVQAHLQSTIGDVYRALGRPEKAETMHREVLATVTNLWAGDHPDVASALVNLGGVLQDEGKLDEAESFDRRALTMRKTLFGDGSPEVADTLECLAEVMGLKGNLKEAERMLREAVATKKKVFGIDSPEVADSVQNLGQTMRVEGKLGEAEAMEREALATRRRHLGDSHLDVATSLNGLGIVLDEQGRLDESETAYREALRLRRKLLGAEHSAVAETLNNLANLLQERSNWNESEEMHSEALVIEKKLLGSEHPAIANSLNNLSFVFRDQGKLAEAEAAEREALDLWRKSFGPEHLQVATALNNLATILRDQGKLAEAEQRQRDSLAMHRRLLGPQSLGAARALNNLAVILRRENKLGEAETGLRQAIALRRELLGSDHLDLAVSLEELAGVLQLAGNTEEPGALLAECLNIREKKLPNSWLYFCARSELGGHLLARKEYAQAEQFLISGYSGLRQQEAKIPVPSKAQIKYAAQRLIHFYQQTRQPDKAAEWEDALRQMTNAVPKGMPRPDATKHSLR